MLQGGHDTARRPCDTAPRQGQQGHDTVDPRARAWGRPGVATQSARGCDTTPSALRHGVRALQHARQRKRHGSRQGPVLRYKLCIVTEGPATRLGARVTRPVRSTTRPTTQPDTATTRPNTATTRHRCAPRHCAVSTA